MTNFKNFAVHEVGRFFENSEMSQNRLRRRLRRRRRRRLRRRRRRLLEESASHPLCFVLSTAQSRVSASSKIVGDMKIRWSEGSTLAIFWSWCEALSSSIGVKGPLRAKSGVRALKRKIKVICLEISANINQMKVNL